MHFVSLPSSIARDQFSRILVNYLLHFIDDIECVDECRIGAAAPMSDTRCVSGANILARFYCEDPEDPEAKRQRPAARRVIVDSPALFVPRERCRGNGFWQSF